jgi:hypothetical protein
MVAAVIVFPTSGEANCPVGSYPWTDQWGNSICKRFSTGQPSTIEGTLSRCPTGTHPWVDNWGNQVCQSFDQRQRFYDTSKGCPVGSYEWVDSWGNKVCKFF